VHVAFAKAFRRHVDCPDEQVSGVTVGDALDAYFSRHPAVRGYVVDDVGAMRRHIALFLNDDLIIDRTSLTDPLAEGDRVHVFQALSGG
jgi:molybdopterin converting factor small subunit